MKKYLLGLVFFCCALPFGIAQQSPNFNGFDKKLDEFVTALSKVSLFSGNVLVSHQNELIFQKGYGWASRRFQIPHNPGTVYRAGSVTKSFTAIAILQLYDQGKLDLNDFLSKYLDDFPFGDQIQIKHLLSHTSGLARDIQFPDERRRSLEELIPMCYVDSLLYQPGTKMSYSNRGYIPLHFIIEKLSGMPLEAYFKENIWEPLGLKNVGIENPEIPPLKMADGFGIGVDNKGNFAITETHLKSLFYSEGVGGLYASAEDLARFCHQIGQSSILKPATWNMALTSFLKPERGYSWGYGFNIYESNGLTIYNHNGRTTGFRGGYFYYPKWDMAIVILGNNSVGNRAEIVNAVESILLGKKYYQPEVFEPQKWTVKQLEAYVGAYKTANFTFKISLEEDQLYVASHGDPPTKIHPYAADSFFSEFFDLKLKFKKKKGEGLACDWIYKGQVTKAKQQ